MARLVFALTLFVAACSNGSNPPPPYQPPPPAYDAGSPYPPYQPPPNTPRNTCGGTQTLYNAVNAPCGACNTGHYACSGTENLVCMGERYDSRNACGGCSPLSSTVGAPCGSGAVWTCDGPDRVSCFGAGGGGGGTFGRNDCGGTSFLEHNPGNPCGVCDAGRYECQGTENVVCVGGPTQIIDISSSGSVDASSTNPRYPEGNAIDGERSTSWFSSGPEGSPTTFTWSNFWARCFGRIEVLSNADNWEPLYRTDYGFGRVRVEVRDFWGSVKWSQEFDLPGTPDRDIYVETGGIKGYSVRLVLMDHENFDGGGFSELRIGELR